MRVYKKKDIMQIPEKEEFVRDIKHFADQKLAHLFSLTEEDISRVLTALSYYCEQKGSNATERIHEHILLQMIQYKAGTCGYRFELWAM